MINKRICSYILVWWGMVWYAVAQPFTFAHVTDTHVGGSTGADDLRRTVSDINSLPGIAFVILSGDVTEFGSDEELRLARQILDSLQVPWYVIPGNHDTNWSENGGNTFRTVFGAETFAFTYGGYRFAGTNSGPNMRMSPGQVPRENLVWLDSLFAAAPDPQQPLIYINHYPQDSSLNNWYEAIDRIKTQNVQLMLCGHGHQNKREEFEGIPSVMGRSNLRTSQPAGGYNLVTIGDGSAVYRERVTGVSTKEPWAVIQLKNHRFATDTRTWPRPYYGMNEKYRNVQPVWTFTDSSDIGAGMATYKKLIIAANTGGQVYALDSRSGKKKWTAQTGGKIYGTPAVWKDVVVVGSSDHFIYGIAAKNGKQLWKLQAGKPVLGSPLIHQGVAYIGASDGVFRAIHAETGELLWAFDGIQGHVTAKSLLYRNTIYTGSWDNGFYAFDLQTGDLKWEWKSGYTNRMLSPAACYPVGANGRVFVVAPDRSMTALDAATGAVVWRRKVDSIRVRESMGLSADSSLVYVKTMDGELLGVSVQAPDMEISWRSGLRLPYELAPSAISAQDGLVFVPSHAGLLSAVHAATGAVSWQYKVSNALVNPLLLLRKGRVVVSTMDGSIACLTYTREKK